jgi:hypothetical protein
VAEQKARIQGCVVKRRADVSLPRPPAARTQLTERDSA